MENRNNALHYKMYKSGKSIVYAGLATTAAVAGLALANANATAVHADATPAATEQVANNNSAAKPAAASTATSAQLSAAQSAVNVTSDAVTSAQNAVNTAEAAVKSAETINSGVTAVNQASSAYSAAKKAQSDAQNTRVQDVKNFNSASAEMRDQLINANNAFPGAAIDPNASDSNAINANYAKAAKNYNELVSDNQAVVTSNEAKIKANDATVNQLSDSVALKESLISDLQQQIDTVSVELESATNQNRKNQLATLRSNLQAQLDKAALDLDHVAGRFGTDDKGGLKQQLAAAKGMNDFYNNNISAANTAIKNGQQGLADLKQALNDYTAANSALVAAQIAENTANANVKQARKAYDSAMEAYGLPNAKELAKIKNAVDQAQTAVNVDNNYLNQSSEYKAASAALAKAQKAVSDATVNSAAASDAVVAAQKAVSDATEQLNSAKSEQAALPSDATLDQKKAAQKKVTDANTKLLDANIQLGSANDNVANAKQQLRNANKLVQTSQAAFDNVLKNSTVNVNGNPVNVGSILDSLKKDQAALTAAQNKLATVTKNLDVAKDAQTAIDNANAQLAQAQQALKDAKVNYQNALDALKALQGGATPDQPDQPSTPDQPSDKPGQNTSDNNNGNTNTNKDNVASDFTGEKNGNYYVNGKQVTKAAYDAHVANQSLATVKAPAKSASAAATANDSKALPQTGNENALAIVALGAVSAMFGLGLAAKKREF